jgi:WD40 repeat protein
VPQAGDVGLAFSPNGEQIALCSLTHLSIWDVSKSLLLYRIDLPSATTGLRPSFIWWLATGPYVAVGGTDVRGQGRLIVWDCDTRKMVKNFRIETGAHDMDLSSEGRFMLTGNDGDAIAHLWDTKRRKKVRLFKTRGTRVKAGRIAPGNEFVVTVSEGGSTELGRQDYVELWDVRSSHVVFWDVLTPEYRGIAPCFSTDGRFCAINHWGHIHVWDAVTPPSSMGVVRSPVASVATRETRLSDIKGAQFVASGRELCTFHVDENVRLWKWDRGSGGLVSRLWRKIH